MYFLTLVDVGAVTRVRDIIHVVHPLYPRLVPLLPAMKHQCPAAECFMDTRITLPPCGLPENNIGLSLERGPFKMIKNPNNNSLKYIRLKNSV